MSSKVREHVARPFAAYADRYEAGKRLAEYIGIVDGGSALIMGIPRGGVAVGQALSDAFDAPLGILLTRKLPLPWSPEMGFGAVTIDGSLFLNGPIVSQLGLEREEIERISRRVIDELERRAREYGVPGEGEEAAGKTVYVVDDGLATGYTAIAAARMMEKRRPSELVLAVPVSPMDSLEEVSGYYDKTYCLIEQARSPFAVASYYDDFHDMSDDEVRQIVSSAKH